MLVRRRRWKQWAVLLVLVVVAGFFFRSMLISALQTGAGFALSLVYLLAYLFAIFMLPLMFFALMKFAYSVFMRPYVRVWHINRIRSNRHLKEVMKRSRRQN